MSATGQGQISPNWAKLRHAAPGECRKIASAFGLRGVGNHRRSRAGSGSYLFLLRELAMPVLFRSPALLFFLIVSCSSGAPNSTPGPEPGDQLRARIENRASLDMDIYVVRGDGQSHRLGFIPGGETATFALPPTVTAGAMSITFEARPVRRSGQPVRSEPFGVHGGEEIVWSIPPQ